MGLLMLSLSSVMAQHEPYKNPALSPDDRAWDLVERMTLEEKIGQMVNNAAPVERLGIRQYDWWNEALHGVARAGLATVFPQTIGMAATFDDEAVYETFNIVSDEARAKYHAFQKANQLTGYKGLTFWTPNINIFRDPRWGRGQETYGEDPCLTTRMGLAVVRGLQGDGSSRYDKTHACAKHFAVHSGPEWNRHSFDAKNIAPRDLYETYLPAFKALVMEGKVREVMCAYNRFEGEPCCGNKQLLVRILRDDWGFDDVVVSDCGAIGDFFHSGAHKTHASATDAAADAVLSGTDLECVGMSYPQLKEAVDRGLISEADIDESVFRLMRARIQLGMFDNDSLVPWSRIPYSVVASPGHRRHSLDMARKSMTLLTNRNNTLPLSKRLRKIAVIGPNADDSVMMWGNYNGTPSHTVTILDGIRAKLPDAEVVYTRGCDYVDNMVMYSLFNNCAIDGKKGMKASYWNNKYQAGAPEVIEPLTSPLQLTTDGGTPFAAGVRLNDFSGRFETVFTPEQSGVYNIYFSYDDGARLTVDGRPLVDDWHNGPTRTKVVPLEVEAGHSYDIRIDYYNAGGGGELKFDIGYKQELDYEAVARSVSDADVIVFVGGLSPRLEGEEMPVSLPGFKKGDRTAIELPAVQEDLLKALKATGRPVVFVLCAGSAVAMPWEAENIDAILDAWYPGQEGGTAVADVLFGDYNPAGRLPVTFYASTDDLPDFEDYSMDNRTYRYFKGTPLFAFGHGLSYSDFAYGKASLKSGKLKPGKDVTMTIPLSNTSDRDGDEVIQVYIRNLKDASAPQKWLAAFRRVSLKAGESKNVSITVPAKAFETYDEPTGLMKVKPGAYELLYGGTSDDKGLMSVKLK